MRWLGAIVLAAFVCVGLTIAGWMIGGTECDSGQCPWLGEFIDETWPLYPALALAVGLAVGFAVARRA